MSIQIRILNAYDTQNAGEYIRKILAEQRNVAFPLLEVEVQLPDGAWMSALQPLGFNET